MRKFMGNLSLFQQLTCAAASVRLFIKACESSVKDQGISWDFAQRGQDAGVDRHQRLCVGGHYQEGTQARAKHERNSANFEPQSFRENPAFYGTFGQNGPE